LAVQKLGSVENSISSQDIYSN